MSNKPILFNTEMVRAILAGLKTQTRRVVKGMPLYEPYFTVDEGIPFACDGDGEWHPAEYFCPIQPGDVLWVRETWNYGYIESSDTEGSHESWFEELRKPAIGYLGAMSRYFYLADESDEQIMSEIGGKWRPSIHMPREAARIFLRVKDVRMERLQQIDADGMRAEGLTSAAVHVGDMEIGLKEWEKLWNSTIKPADLPRYGWEANPWVWVFEFDMIEN